MPSIDCENRVTDRSRALGGELKAVVFTRACGATTEISTQVSVITDDSSPRGVGNVLVLDSDSGRAPSDSVGRVAVTLAWRGVDTLIVRHDRRARVYKSERVVLGVTVIVRADSLP